eukprot:15481245-Alexandrium_andersonii.AAC.1
MLKALKDESLSPGTWARKYPKTSGFRKSLDHASWKWLGPLVNALQNEPLETTKHATPKEEAEDAQEEEEESED